MSQRERQSDLGELTSRDDERNTKQKRCDNDREICSQTATMRGILAHKPERDKEQAGAIMS